GPTGAARRRDRRSQRCVGLLSRPRSAAPGWGTSLDFLMRNSTRSRQLDKNVAQEFDRFLDAFQRGQHRVLVLDAENVVVSDRSEDGDQLPPPQLAMAVAQRDVVPGAALEAIAGRRFDDTVYAGDHGVDPRVLGVEVINGLAQGA